MISDETNQIIAMHTKNFLLTGPPGSGKTTVIRAVAEGLRDLSPTGFYTAEIRVRGIRQGFELVSLEGGRSVLSDARGNHGPIVGKYRVNIEDFEAFLSTLTFDSSVHRLFIIDEIGKMECFSLQFRSLVITLLDSPVPLLATIPLHGNAYIEAIKHRNDVEVFLLTRENRDSMADLITEKIRKVIDQIA
ncbi:MAG: AAA family ATPase [Methanomicrobiales archaeon]|nr:AAA family ATPase [Methanomicrobiales archaeon]